MNPLEPLGPQRRERVEALWALRATVGISEPESAELSGLLADAGLAEDDPGFDTAAAVLALGELRVAAIPPQLALRIQAQADRSFRPRDTAAAPQAPTPTRRAEAPVSATPRPRTVLAFLGGALSAAAVFALVMFLQQPPAADTPALTDARTSAWSVFHNGYESVTGQVAWSREAQGGVMRLRGLPANDPRQAQYQLWIVDPARDAEPVDGGVFDIPAGQAGATVEVPFAAKLPVGRPTAFAITLEQPGGVVVSEGPLLVTALMPTGS